MGEKIGGEEVPDSTRDLEIDGDVDLMVCLLYTSPSPRDS